MLFEFSHKSLMFSCTFQNTDKNRERRPIIITKRYNRIHTFACIKKRMLSSKNTNYRTFDYATLFFLEVSTEINFNFSTLCLFLGRITESYLSLAASCSLAHRLRRTLRLPGIEHENKQNLTSSNADPSHEIYRILIFTL